MGGACLERVLELGSRDRSGKRSVESVKTRVQQPIFLNTSARFRLGQKGIRAWDC
jgi:hypothetical protein